MSKGRSDRRAYSPVGQLLPEPSGSGPAALRPLIETSLSVSGTPAVRADEVPRQERAPVDAFSAEAIERSREAEDRHRRARRSAKTRGSRRLFD